MLASYVTIYVAITEIHKNKPKRLPQLQLFSPVLVEIPLVSKDECRS